MAKKKKPTMTVDERLEFLLQSTESLHSSMQELHYAHAKTEREVARFARLARIVAGNHGRRITNLEKRIT